MTERPYTPPQIYRNIMRDIRECRLEMAQRKLDGEAARPLRILERNELQRALREQAAKLARV